MSEQETPPAADAIRVHPGEVWPLRPGPSAFEKPARNHVGLDLVGAFEDAGDASVVGGKQNCPAGVKVRSRTTFSWSVKVCIKVPFFLMLWSWSIVGIGGQAIQSRSISNGLA